MLLALVVAVRAGELHLDGWEPSLRDQRLRTQFEAQRRGYREDIRARDIPRPSGHDARRHLGAERVSLRLVDVAGERTSGGFVRLSVLFHGPPDRLLAQGSYAFHHQALGSLVLFIVPVVGSDAERIVYEACFSQPVPARLPAAPLPPTPPREDA